MEVYEAKYILKKAREKGVSENCIDNLACGRITRHVIRTLLRMYHEKNSDRDLYVADELNDWLKAAQLLVKETNL